VFDIWPQEDAASSGTPTLNGVTFKKPETWTEEDWDYIRRREDKLLEMLTE
jgi:hypothetical protein